VRVVEAVSAFGLPRFLAVTRPALLALGITRAAS
jgi:hypothetical protein